MRKFFIMLNSLMVVKSKEDVLNAIIRINQALYPFFTINEQVELAVKSLNELNRYDINPPQSTGSRRGPKPKTV